MVEISTNRYLSELDRNRIITGNDVILIICSTGVCETGNEGRNSRTKYVYNYGRSIDTQFVEDVIASSNVVLVLAINDTSRTKPIAE